MLLTKSPCKLASAAAMPVRAEPNAAFNVQLTRIPVAHVASSRGHRGPLTRHDAELPCKLRAFHGLTSSGVRLPAFVRLCSTRWRWSMFVLVCVLTASSHILRSLACAGTYLLYMPIPPDRVGGNRPNGPGPASIARDCDPASYPPRLYRQYKNTPDAPHSSSCWYACPLS